MTQRGFTLIELLIVVVIIGILAAVAIPKFSSTKAKAYVASMKTDLKNLSSAQEAYYYDNAVYYNGPVPDPAFDFSPTKGVVINITAGDPAGWAATATYPPLPNICGIYVGTAPIPAPAVTEGAPACS